MSSLSRAISAGADDGTMYDGTIENTGTTLIVDGGFNSQAWLRFQNVTIPQGAVISAATITLIGASGSGTLTVTFKAQNADSAGALSVGEDGTGRTWTSAAANTWAIPTLSAGTSYTGPDITDILQTVVNRGGWASGNNMLIALLYSSSSGGASRAFRSGDNGSSPKYAVLDVTYSSGGRMTQTLIIG